MRGRRSTLPREKREELIRKAINRSGLTEIEVLQLLVNWYQMKALVIEGVSCDTRITPGPHKERNG